VRCTGQTALIKASRRSVCHVVVPASGRRVLQETRVTAAHRRAPHVCCKTQRPCRQPGRQGL
jgi:hypothetical protein